MTEEIPAAPSAPLTPEEELLKADQLAAFFVPGADQNPALAEKRDKIAAEIKAKLREKHASDA